MPKPEANQPSPARAPISEVLANASAANDAAEVQRVTNDLVAAVGDGLKAAGAPAPLAPARNSFTAHSQAAHERLLTEERAAADILNDLDAKILELTDQRDDAFRAYSAWQGARAMLGGGL